MTNKQPHQHSSAPNKLRRHAALSAVVLLLPVFWSACETATETSPAVAGETVVPLSGTTGVQSPAATLALPTTAAAPSTSQSTSPAAAPATAAPTTAPASDGRTWYTSSASNAQYYYCDLDDGWKTLSQSNLRAYGSEAALKAAWGNSRVKHSASKC
ncbi:hypothetical protein [Candidatus Amarobacter glycogenicus]|uniref:hypothetical protein n=1 Tax=Candidatus Amarobacter glycogenicus TaxID=3140699 RepID=UPI003135F42B|nr:hypothetical protein [Dehalococcoidia bacterium]